MIYNGNRGMKTAKASYQRPKMSGLVNAKSVARHCLSLMLTLTNNILIQKRAFKNNEWLRSYNLSPQNIFCCFTVACFPHRNH